MPASCLFPRLLPAVTRGASAILLSLLLTQCAPSAPVAGAAQHPPLAATVPPSAWPYPDSLDALVAAPQFHRVLFENEQVRVLEVRVGPHQREPVHTHRWPSVIYKDQVGKGRYYDGSGQLRFESTKPYQAGPAFVRARWQAPEGPHAVENTDEMADRFIRVELKQ